MLIWCYTMLIHNQRGYYNSLILQALELLPGRAERELLTWIAAVVRLPISVPSLRLRLSWAGGTNLDRFYHILTSCSLVDRLLSQSGRLLILSDRRCRCLLWHLFLCRCLFTIHLLTVWKSISHVLMFLLVPLSFWFLSFVTVLGYCCFFQCTRWFVYEIRYRPTYNIM